MPMGYTFFAQMGWASKFVRAEERWVWRMKPVINMACATRRKRDRQPETFPSIVPTNGGERKRQ